MFAGTVIQYMTLILVSLFGAMIQATIGFGFPVFGMIFFPMVFPFDTAVTLCQWAGTLGVAYFCIKYFKSIQWRTLVPFIIPAVLVGVSLTWYSSQVSVQHLKVGLGFVLMGISAMLLLFPNRAQLKPSTATGVSMGVVSGVLNGFFAIGGPPVALYLLPAIGEKIAYIATVNTYFLTFKFFSLPIRLTNGSITREHIGFLIVSLLSMTAGSVIGDRIMRLVPKRLLQVLVYSFVGISGLIIVFQELY